MYELHSTRNQKGKFINTDIAIFSGTSPLKVTTFTKCQLTQ